MRDNINDLDPSVKKFLMSTSLESLQELHSFVHREASQNESSEQNTDDVKNTSSSTSTQYEEDYNQIELTEKSEENKYDVNKFVKGTPKPSKLIWDDCDDDEEEFGKVYEDSKTSNPSNPSNPYNYMQDTSPYYLRTKNYSEYVATRSSNTTAALS